MKFWMIFKLISRVRIQKMINKFKNNKVILEILKVMLWVLKLMTNRKKKLIKIQSQNNHKMVKLVYKLLKRLKNKIKWAKTNYLKYLLEVLLQTQNKKTKHNVLRKYNMQNLKMKIFLMMAYFKMLKKEKLLFHQKDKMEQVS